jgi:hypothetical protein
MTFFAHRRLIALATLLPVAEVLVLAAVGADRSATLAPQVSAFGPFGVFHDLRWLFVFHVSGPDFALGLGALLAARVGVTAAMTRAALPPDAALPMRVLLFRSMVATGVATMLLWPWVTLLFGAGVIPLSWVFYGALPPALITILLVHHGIVDRDWLRRLPSLRSSAWIAVSFVWLSLAALAVAGRPPAVAVPIVAVAGLGNAWAWYAGVRALAVRAPALRPMPWGVMAIVALLVVVVGGTRIGFAAGEEPDRVVASHLAPEGGPGVLVVAGFSSGCCGDGADLQEALPDATVHQFSYLGYSGVPLPHDGSATDGDLAVFGERMDEQVAELARATGGPVTVVAESEGTLVVAAFLEHHPDAPVERLMLLSPIIEPARVTYPGESTDGPGAVAGTHLRFMTEFVASLAPFDLSADGPLATSLLADAAALRDGVVRDRPGIDELVVVPLGDSVTAPATEPALPVVVVPGFHGGLRGRADVQEMLAAWLDGDPVQGSPVWHTVDRLIAGSAAAWRVPVLPQE